MAASGWPFVSHHVAARRWRSRDVGGLAPLQLRRQQLAEQLVIAEPFPAAIERHHQQVAVLQPLEDCTRSLSSGDRVAERTAHAVEDRGASQEQHLRPRRPVEEFAAEVITHEPVIAGERRSDLGGGAACLDRQGGEVQADRPALGPLDELIHVDFGELDTGCRQQRAGVVAVHRQIAPTPISTMPP